MDESIIFFSRVSLSNAEKFPSSSQLSLELVVEEFESLRVVTYALPFDL